MKFILIAIMASSAQAGWWSTFCEKYLVADDPWPMAEMPTEKLLLSYDRKPTEHVLKELVYRLRHDMLSTEEAHEFWYITNKKKSNEPVYNRR